MSTFKVWRDGREAIRIHAVNMEEALDIYAQNLGAIDHADYCVENGLEESDLNIKEIYHGNI